VPLDKKKKRDQKINFKENLALGLKKRALENLTAVNRSKDFNKKRVGRMGESSERGIQRRRVSNGSIAAWEEDLVNSKSQPATRGRNRGNSGVRRVSTAESRLHPMESKRGLLKGKKMGSGLKSVHNEVQKETIGKKTGGGERSGGVRRSSHAIIPPFG